MTVVDTFFKYVFLERLKNKDAQSVEDAYARICETKSHTFPSILYSDNGLEFANEKLGDYCDENGTKQVFSATYTPVGLVEATNAIIRQILRAIFLKTGSLNWSNFIPQIETNINDRSAVSTGKPRKEIYERTL